jgi:hypothetical protein
MVNFLVLAMPVAGGGGMAPVSLLDRLGPYLGWGLLMIVICSIAISFLRRLYRAPEDQPDDSGD